MIEFSTRRTFRTAGEAGVLYEEATGTLLCGDLFTQLGDAWTVFCW
jgi:hypothetical protein